MREAFFQVLGNRDLLLYITSFQHGKKFDSIHDGDWCCDKGYLSLLKIKKDLVFSQNSLIMASLQGHLEIVQWLYYNVPAVFERYLPDCHTFKNQHIVRNDRVQITFHHHSFGMHLERNVEDVVDKCGQALTAAAINGHFLLVQWLYKHTKMEFLQEYFEKVIERGHLPIVWWLLDKYPELYQNITARIALSMDQVFLLREIIYDRHMMEKPSNRSMEFDFLILDAIQKNALNCLEWLIQQLPPDYNLEFTIAIIIIEGKMEYFSMFYEHIVAQCLRFKRTAIASNQLEILKKLHEYDPTPVHFSIAGEISLETLIWLHNNGYEFPDEPNFNVTNLMAMNIDVIEWLYDTYGYYKNEFMDRAIDENNLKLMEKFDSDGKKCSSRGLASALKQDNLEVVQWLDDRGNKITSDMVFILLQYDSRKILHWLCENKSHLFHELSEEQFLEIFGWAVENNNLELIKWFYEYYRIAFNCYSYSKLASRGGIPNMNVLEWFIDKGIFPDRVMIDRILRDGNLPVLKYILERKKLYITTALRIAAKEDQLEVFVWLNTLWKSWNTNSLTYAECVEYFNCSLTAKSNNILYWLFNEIMTLIKPDYALKPKLPLVVHKIGIPYLHLVCPVND